MLELREEIPFVVGGRAGHLPGLRLDRVRLNRRDSRGKRERWFEMKIDVSQLPYGAVIDAVANSRWVVKNFVCDNGRVVLDCAPA